MEIRPSTDALRASVETSTPAKVVSNSTDVQASSAQIAERNVDTVEISSNAVFAMQLARQIRDIPDVRVDTVKDAGKKVSDNAKSYPPVMILQGLFNLIASPLAVKDKEL